MLGKPVEEIITSERQRGKCAELACGFGGSVGAWRRIFDDPRPDHEIKGDILKWRQLHPRICRFWKRLFKAVQITVRHGVAIRVNEAPLPEIVASLEDGNLYITLPSGRSLTYPNARLVPGKYEDPDLAFHDNSKSNGGKCTNGSGPIVENVVQAIARDLLAAAIVRFEARGLPVVFHCHDEAVVEVPAGNIADADVLAILTEPPAWAAGLPLAGSVHSGPHYLAEPDDPLKPIDDTPPDPVEHAIEELVASTQSEIVLTPAEMERARTRGRRGRA